MTHQARKNVTDSPKSAPRELSEEFEKPEKTPPTDEAKEANDEYEVQEKRSHSKEESENDGHSSAK